MSLNKKLLITGGTGSFGKTVLNQFISNPKFNEINENNEEKKREKVQKIYTLIGCGVGLVFIFGTLIYF